MDIGYWIFILIIYLLSQYFKKKRRSVPHDRREQKPVERELPGWLKELGFPEMEEKASESMRKRERVPEYSQPTPLRQEIDEFDQASDWEAQTEVESETIQDALRAQIEPAIADKIAQEEQISLKQRGERKRFASKMVMKQTVPQAQFDQSNIVKLFFQPETLKGIIIAREILNPPRIVRRSRITSCK